MVCAAAGVICQLPPSTLLLVRLGVTVMTAPSTFSCVFSWYLSVLTVNVKSKLPLALCAGAVHAAE